MSKNKNKQESLNKKGFDWKIISFFIVPFISSIVSTLHIIKLAALGNEPVLAYIIAGTYELGAISSFLVVANPYMLSRIKRGGMLFIFVILFLTQALGNLYAVFNYIEDKLVSNPEYLQSFKKIFYNFIDNYTSEMIISFFVGVLLPLISLIFLESASRYFVSVGNDGLKSENEDDKEHELEDLTKDEIKDMSDLSKDVAKPIIEDLEKKEESNKKEDDFFLFKGNSKELELKQLKDNSKVVKDFNEDLKEKSEEVEIKEEKKDNKELKKEKKILNELDILEEELKKEIPPDDLKEEDEYDEILKEVQENNKEDIKENPDVIKEPELKKEKEEIKKKKELKEDPENPNIKYEIITEKGIDDVTGKVGEKRMPFQNKKENGDK